MPRKFEHPAIAMERRLRDKSRHESAQERRWALTEDGGKLHFARIMGDVPFPENAQDWRNLLAQTWERGQYIKLYRLYLRSPEWQEKRARVINRDKCCRICGAVNFLVVHHVNYFTVGDEELSSLTTVCKDCHDSHHHEPLYPY